MIKDYKFSTLVITTMAVIIAMAFYFGDVIRQCADCAYTIDLLAGASLILVVWAVFVATVKLYDEYDY